MVDEVEVCGDTAPVGGAHGVAVECGGEGEGAAA